MFVISMLDRRRRRLSRTENGISIYLFFGFRAIAP